MCARMPYVLRVGACVHIGYGSRPIFFKVSLGSRLGSFSLVQTRLFAQSCFVLVCV